MNAHYLQVLVILMLTGFVVNAQNNTAYGLNFTSAGVKFASFDMTTGEVEILSDGIVSPQGFAQGVADFDPVSKSYFFIQGGGNNTKVYQINAQTGAITNSSIIDDPNAAVIPLTNIAFNWMDGKLYGVSHEYNGSDLLKFVTVDPSTGILTYLSDTPTSTGAYSSGNSDIDPIHRKYYYVASDRIYTVDLDSGIATSAAIEFPDYDSNQFLANLMYNYMDQKLYGLHFLAVPDDNIFDEDYYHSELRLASIDPETGVLDLISEEPTSNDGFSMGDCDIDTANDRYLYIRQDALYSVDLNSGEVLDVVPLENENQAVVPIINMAYDDLSDQLAPMTMQMGETRIMEPGASLEVSAWIGDDLQYQWSDGSTDHSRTITEPGQYDLEIIHGGFTVQGKLLVEMTESATSIEEPVEGKMSVYPNPAQAQLFLDLNGQMVDLAREYRIVDVSGKVLKSGALIEGAARHQIPLQGLPSGTYLLELLTEQGSNTARFQIK